MIIKKKKNYDENQPIKPPTEQEEVKKINNPPEQTLFDAFQHINERQERRRGDRRRGYRRIDDRNLISRAEEEANTIKEKAAKEGFKVGIEQSNREIENLRDAIASVLSAKEDAYELYKDDIIFIALKVAEKIIKTEVQSNQEIILKIVSAVIKEVGKDENRIIIKTNPSDVEFLNEKLPELFSLKNSKVNILVEEDNSVDKSSCIVQTQSGQIDATFTTQLGIIQQAFKEGF